MAQGVDIGSARCWGFPESVRSALFTTIRFEQGRRKRTFPISPYVVSVPCFIHSRASGSSLKSAFQTSGGEISSFLAFAEAVAESGELLPEVVVVSRGVHACLEDDKVSRRSCRTYQSDNNLLCAWHLLISPGKTLSW